MDLIKRNKSLLTSFGGMITVILFFAIITGGAVFSSSNLQLILNQSYALVIMAIGVSFIIAHGGIDFSCASVTAVSAMSVALLSQSGMPIISAGLLGVIISMLLFAITGLLTVVFNVPAFIASLCMMNIGRGLVILVIATNSITLDVDVTLYRSWGLKLAVLIAIVIAAYLLMNRSLVGSYNKAIGANAIAALQAGVPIKRYRMIAYLFCGFCVGIAAFFYLCRNPKVTTGFANGLQLEVLVAVMLGGMPPKGGYKSSIRCAIIGSVILGIINVGLILVGVDDLLIEGIEGVVFLLTIFIFYKGGNGSWQKLKRKKSDPDHSSNVVNA